MKGLSLGTAFLVLFLSAASSEVFTCKVSGSTPPHYQFALDDAKPEIPLCDLLRASRFAPLSSYQCSSLPQFANPRKLSELLEDGSKKWCIVVAKSDLALLRLMATTFEEDRTTAHYAKAIQIFSSFLAIGIILLFLCFWKTNENK